MMNMTELQELLGKHIAAIDNSATMKAVDRQIELENSAAISNLAKNMIANAKVMLQAEQLGTTVGGVIK